MSLKSTVRKLPTLSSFHIPISHRRYQNRAAAVYDMTLDCHDIETVCHIHRLAASTVLQDWKGDRDYLQSKLNLANRPEIKKRFQRILKEVQHDNIQPTLGKRTKHLPLLIHSIVVSRLAAVAHYIPFVYIEQAIGDGDLTNALNCFLDDFKPKKPVETESTAEKPMAKFVHDGQPILTRFEQHLLLEHLRTYLSTSTVRTRHAIEKCLLEYIQQIMRMNFSTIETISHLNRTWLKAFLLWTQSQTNPIDLSCLPVDAL